MSVALLEALRAVASPETYVGDDWHERMAAARDCWPWLMLGAKSGELAPVMPAVVARPRSAAEAAEIVKATKQAGGVVQAWGGGSGVVGAGLTTDPRPSVALDLKALKSLDLSTKSSGMIWAGAGWMGTHLEEALQKAGVTLGHFPSSIHCSTLGGWLASRSAGQISTRHGKIEDMVVAIRYIDAAGELRTTRPSTGADFTQILVGSEGSYGVIVEACVYVSPLPKAIRARGFLSSDLSTALDALQAVMQAGLRPAALRLYDPFDTAISSSKGATEGSFAVAPRPLEEQFSAQASGIMKILGSGGVPLGNQLLSRLGGGPAALRKLSSLAFRECLLIATVEEDDDEAADAAAEDLFSALGEKMHDLGPGPGLYWYEHRHDVSWKMSPLIQAGLFIDTMEVVVPWGKVEQVYNAVRTAVSPWAFSMAHFSHSYISGSAIYFTYAGFGKDLESVRAAYKETWRAALDAATRNGASSTHHHGAGLLKGDRRYQDHVGGDELHEEIDKEIDPEGLLNPGKWARGEMPWPH